MIKKTISLLLIFMMIITIAIPTNVFGIEKDFTGHWAENTIQSWLDNGYVSGYPNGSFKPEGSVTRAEFVKMVNNLFGYTETYDISFTDVNKNDWYYQEVQKAFKAGYITGVSKTKFAPNDILTREQAAVIISKIMKLDGNSVSSEIFKDSDTISSWAKDYVGSAYEAELIKGYNDNSFKPQEPIKRAEAIVLLDRSINMELADLTIDKAGTIVENKIVNNLHITKEVGNGEVTLKNVTIKGELLVEGGGLNSIIIEDSIINKLTTNKEDGKVRILIEGKTSVDFTSVKSESILEQQKLTGQGFEELAVYADSSVILTSDKKITWSSSNTKIATISLEGELTAKNIGNAMIFSINADENKTSISKVTVLKNPVKYADLTAYYKTLDSVSKSNYTEESWTTYKAVIASNVVKEINAQAEVDVAIETIKEAQTKLEIKKLDLNNKTIKILTIGNSFSEDATRWICEIAESAGVKVIVGNLYFSGCSLENHWTNALNNKALYTYYKLTSTSITDTSNQTMKESILDEDWDFITFQQFSGFSGLYSTFQPYLNNLIGYVNAYATNSDVKLALNMTWAYANDSTHEDYLYYSNNQTAMYNAITSAHQQAIAETGIDIIIPCGTAIQNARTNKLLNAVGDELTRDGHHLDIGIGRYITGLTFFETLIVNSGNVKKDLFKDVTYIPDTYGSNENLANLAKIAVMNAISNPYKVTNFE